MFTLDYGFNPQHQLPVLESDYPIYEGYGGVVEIMDSIKIENLDKILDIVDTYQDIVDSVLEIINDDYN